MYVSFEKSALNNLLIGSFQDTDTTHLTLTQNLFLPCYMYAIVDANIILYMLTAINKSSHRSKYFITKSALVQMIPSTKLDYRHKISVCNSGEIGLLP